MKIAAILKILSIIEEAIQTGRLISKRSVFGVVTLGKSVLTLERIRDIYYTDPAYFKSQSIVDKIVDDLAYTIGVERTALNVVGLDGDSRWDLLICVDLSFSRKQQQRDL